MNFNRIESREDVQQLVRVLSAPLKAHTSEAGARVSLGTVGARRSETAAQMEGYARQLWGLAPLAAGGGEWDGWDRVVAGLIAGTDPEHPEYWGAPGNLDPRFVESAAISYALCLTPEKMWQPLSATQQANVVRFLASVNSRDLRPNNWLFFGVLANVAMRQLEAGHDAAALSRALDQLESFYQGDGWYSDGKDGEVDYYCGFAMHFYGLLYASLAGQVDPARAARFRQRAREFAAQFMHWFADDGSALPFGRSLTYRFAQASFWGALAFAGEPALPWGALKGIVLRHLRWWLRQRIFSDGGLLTLGYAYPNLNMAEDYNSAASPYWAFKAFLPLALPATHPFWTSKEEPHPAMPAERPQPRAGMIVCRDVSCDHVFALSAGPRRVPPYRHGAEKYAKFCYSNRFGFGVPVGTSGLENAAHDSMLALSEEGKYFRVREATRRARVAEHHVVSEWRPWPDVRVTTWLVAAGAWHARIHHLQSARELISAEGGFALDVGDEYPPALPQTREGHASVSSETGSSEIRDLLGRREARVVRSSSNSNLLYPRVVIPTLLGRHKPGDQFLGCVVGASYSAAAVAGEPPVLVRSPESLQVKRADGEILLSLQFRKKP